MKKNTKNLILLAAMSVIGVATAHAGATPVGGGGVGSAAVLGGAGFTPTPSITPTIGGSSTGGLTSPTVGGATTGGEVDTTQTITGGKGGEVDTTQTVTGGKGSEVDTTQTVTDGESGSKGNSHDNKGDSHDKK